MQSRESDRQELIEEDLNSAIVRAVAYLADRQLPSGQFPAWQFQDSQLRGEPTAIQSPFDTTFVAYALSFLDDELAREMRSRALSFLIRACDPGGLWCFFLNDDYRRNLGPDMDDTCCAAFVVASSVPEIRENEPFLLQNRDSEGLFKTWFRRADLRNTIDSVVNANAVLYLGEREECNAACDFLNAAVVSGDSATLQYYLDPLSLHYAVSRAYFHGASRLAPAMGSIPRILGSRQEPDGTFGAEIYTAMAVCSLVNASTGTDAATRRAVYALLRSQSADGSWHRWPHYASVPGSRAYYWGSEVCTTAFCLEALAKVRRVL